MHPCAHAPHALAPFARPMRPCAPQVMSLIAYLMEKKSNFGPHLIIVPNAVLVNWKAELTLWLPSVRCVYYTGNKVGRRGAAGRVVAGRGLGRGKAGRRLGCRVPACLTGSLCGSSYTLLGQAVCLGRARRPCCPSPTLPPTTHLMGLVALPPIFSAAPLALSARAPGSFALQPTQHPPTHRALRLVPRPPIKYAGKYLPKGVEVLTKSLSLVSSLVWCAFF